jgi:hypothetical protein
MQVSETSLESEKSVNWFDRKSDLLVLTESNNAATVVTHSETLVIFTGGS